MRQELPRFWHVLSVLIRRTAVVIIGALVTCAVLVLIAVGCFLCWLFYLFLFFMPTYMYLIHVFAYLAPYSLALRV